MYEPLSENEREIALSNAAREDGETRKWLNLVLEAYDYVSEDRDNVRRLLDHLASVHQWIVCPRCEGQRYDRLSCVQCNNIGFLDENEERLIEEGLEIKQVLDHARERGLS